MTLDDRLRALAKRGELTHVSVAAVAGKGGVAFAASFAPAGVFGAGHATHADPVTAIEQAIDSIKLPPKRAKQPEPEPVKARKKRAVKCEQPADDFLDM